ncbi:MAG TPA: efflux RND transporter permease subunit, partial [Brevibacillus sp.]|nr:efflux RND transporter permease subunit [Brevibacillus sp.]
SIGKFAITTPTGKTVDLQDIAKIREVQAPSVITRDMQVQTVHVTAKINHQDKGGVSEKLASALKELAYPARVTQEVKGITDDINDGFMQMFVAMGASIFIVYLIMVLAFGNASAPFSILFSLPLAVIGGLLGLYVAQESINITTLTGFLMLIGIVVTNAIVLIDRVNQMRNQGYEVGEALIQSGVSRLRPIIMTAGATIIALLPLAFGMSQGTLISKGLAVVVIGGLTTSTLLTLVVVPIVYQLIYAFQTRMSRIFDRSARSEKGERAI